MTDTPTPKQRRILTDAEVFKAYGLLTAHLIVRDGPEPSVHYEAGWSDQAIADEVGCTLNNIVGLRERNYTGKLTKAPEIVTDPRVSHLIAAHNEFVRDVCTTLRQANIGGLGYEAYLLKGDQS